MLQVPMSIFFSFNAYLYSILLKYSFTSIDVDYIVSIHPQVVQVMLIACETNFLGMLNFEQQEALFSIVHHEFPQLLDW